MHSKHTHTHMDTLCENKPHFIFHYEKPFFRLAQRQRTPWSNKTKAGNGKNQKKERENKKINRKKKKRNVQKQNTKGSPSHLYRSPCRSLTHTHSNTFNSAAAHSQSSPASAHIWSSLCYCAAWPSLGLGLGTTTRRRVTQRAALHTHIIHVNVQKLSDSDSGRGRERSSDRSHSYGHESTMQTAVDAW